MKNVSDIRIETSKDEIARHCWLVREKLKYMFYIFELTGLLEAFKLCKMLQSSTDRPNIIDEQFLQNFKLSYNNGFLKSKIWKHIFY